MDLIPLSPEDRAILELEGDHIVGHTCKVVILDKPFPAVDALGSQIESRLERAPLLRRRLHEGVGGPKWAVAPHLDLWAHVVDSGKASTEVELKEQIATIFASPLDRQRPLWKIDAISLRGEALALVWRIHHALADGVTSMRLGEAVLWDPIRSSDESTAGGHAASAVVHHDNDRRLGHLSAFLRREFGESLSRSPFDGEVGSRRSVAFATVSLPDLHEAARRMADATLNEAVLSIVAGAIRSWLIHHHGSLGSIRLRVPVSLHQQGDDAGNRDSFFTLPVSLDEVDPVERLRQVHTDSAQRKDERDADRIESFMDALGSVSPVLRRFVDGVEGGPRSFALCISNVPGPRCPIHIQGAQVRSLFSLAEVGRRHGLRVAVVSHAGKLEFGICADPGIAPDVEELARGIEAEAAALSAGRG